MCIVGHYEAAIRSLCGQYGEIRGRRGFEVESDNMVFLRHRAFVHREGLLEEALREEEALLAMDVTLDYTGALGLLYVARWRRYERHCMRRS